MREVSPATDQYEIVPVASNWPCRVRMFSMPCRSPEPVAFEKRPVPPVTVNVPEIVYSVNGMLCGSGTNVPL